MDDRALRRIGASLFGLALLASTVASGSETSVVCAEGVELTLSTPRPLQGDIVAVSVKGDGLMEVGARWAEKSLRFWRRELPTPAWSALLGVDLQSKPGERRLTVEAKLDDGGRIGCSARVTIARADFPVQRLEVDEKYVELAAADLERSRRESRRLKDIFRAETSERRWSGDFRPPLEDAKASGSFGRKRILNGQPRSPHSGEDFSRPEGTPVLAPAGARVALVANLFFTGNTVVLDHGFGLVTFYAHLASTEVGEGDLVRAGQVLGTVGSTGRVTGPHLHWGARLHNARVSPLQLLDLTGNPPTD